MPVIPSTSLSIIIKRQILIFKDCSNVDMCATWWQFLIIALNFSIKVVFLQKYKKPCYSTVL